MIGKNIFWYIYNLFTNPSSLIKGPKVGAYTVHVEDFETVALPCLKNINSPVLIIDEIGKMESYSNKFKMAIRKISLITKKRS